jgi:HK97 family phage prohead protease
MRLELTPSPVSIAADAPAAGEPARRRIAGLIVPYEVEARVGFQLVTFARDSVRVEGSSPLLFGHDPNRPVGVLVDHASSAGGLRATYRVDETGDGDMALVQASSGSRAGLSVGVDLETFELDADNEDRIRVTAARLAETSLVALAAYPNAGVDSVAAQRPREGATMETTAEPVAATASGDTPTPAEPTQPAVAHAAEPARPALVIAERPLPELRLGEYVQTFIRAERGDAGARARIEAQLDRGDVTTSPGVVPVTYVQAVIDSLGFARPLYDAMSKADMPAAGMTIRRPEVTTRPNGGWLADDTAGAPTSPVVIGNNDVNVRQWAWGGAASVALVERSAPSYVEEVFTQAIRDYYRDVEALLASAFPTAASTITSIGAAVAAFMAAYRTYPDVIVVGGDAYGKIIDATGVLMFTSGSADARGQASVAGLSIVPSADLTPADAWITTRDFLETRESSPIRLSVSNVESLSLELGVTSFYAQTQTRQNIGGVLGAVRIAGYTPPALQSSTAGRSK